MTDIELGSTSNALHRISIDPSDINDRDSVVSNLFFRTGRGTAQSFMDLAFWPKFKDLAELTSKSLVISMISIVKVGVLVAVFPIYYESVMDNFHRRLLVVVPATSLIILRDVAPFIPRLGLLSTLYITTTSHKCHIWWTIALGCALFVLYVSSSSVLVLSADNFVSSITNSIVLSVIMNCDDVIIKLLAIELQFLNEADRQRAVQESQAWKKGNVYWLNVSFTAWLVLIYFAIILLQVGILLLSFEFS